MSEFASLLRAPIAPIAFAMATGLAMGLRWQHRGERPGLPHAVRCTLLTLPFVYLGFLAQGETLVRPGLFVGLVLGTALAANLLAFAIATRVDRRGAWLAAGLGLGIAGLPALAFVLPNGIHRVLHWNPGYWLTLGFIRAHADDATLGELSLRFPAAFEASYALAPIVLCAGLTWWLAWRAGASL